MTDKKVKIYGIKESNRHGLTPFYCVDKDGNEVRVNPKNQRNHSSNFPLQNNPHVFRNLECVISNPDEKYLSTSQTEKARRLKEKGKIIVHKKHDFYETIDDPNRFTHPHCTMTVPVFYGRDGINYTLTYIEEPEVGEN